MGGFVGWIHTFMWGGKMVVRLFLCCFLDPFFETDLLGPLTSCFLRDGQGARSVVCHRHMVWGSQRRKTTSSANLLHLRYRYFIAHGSSPAASTAEGGRSSLHACQRLVAGLCCANLRRKCRCLRFPTIP